MKRNKSPKIKPGLRTQLPKKADWQSDSLHNDKKDPSVLAKKFNSMSNTVL